MYFGRLWANLSLHFDLDKPSFWFYFVELLHFVGVSPMIKKLWFFFSRTFETLICGWNCFSSLINLTFVHRFRSTSLRITGMMFLKEVGLGRAGVLVGLAVLAPGGELS